MNGAAGKWRFASCLTLFASVTLNVAPLPAQTSADPRLVRSWLLLDCTTGEDGNLARLVQARGELLEAPLLHALQRGPESSDIREIEAVGAARFVQRQTLLADPGFRRRLGPEAERLLRSISREDLLKRERENLVLRYRAQAVAGLGLVGSRRALRELRRLSEDSQSPLRVSARLALRHATNGTRPDPPR